MAKYRGLLDVVASQSSGLKVSHMVSNAQWESARPNLDLPKIEARSDVSA